MPCEALICDSLFDRTQDACWTVRCLACSMKPLIPDLRLYTSTRYCMVFPMYSQKPGVLRAMKRQVCSPALEGRPRLRAGLSAAGALGAGALLPVLASAALAVARAAFGSRPRRLVGACRHHSSLITACTASMSPYVSALPYRLPSGAYNDQSILQCYHLWHLCVCKCKPQR